MSIGNVAHSPDGKPLNWEVRNIELAFTPQQLDAAPGIPFDLQFDVPDGQGYLRTGIYDLSSRKAGTLEIPMSAVTVANQSAAEPEKAQPARSRTELVTSNIPPNRVAQASPAVAAALPTRASATTKAHTPTVVFWKLSPTRVNAMLASPPSGSEARYARLRAYFGQVGCTAALMDEQAIARHEEKNLLCTLPGTHVGQIVVSTHYEQRQNDDPGDPNWRNAVALVQLYKALQAQTRHYTYVFAELSGEDGEKEFLSDLASTQFRSLRALVALDLLVAGRWQYELSWNAFLIAGPHPGDMSPAEARWQDTTSTDVVRTKTLRAGETVKSILVSSLMESAMVNGADQPVHLKPSHAVESAQLFRHSTEIPSILIYSLPDPQKLSTMLQPPDSAALDSKIVDPLADYLCRLDDNLASLWNSTH